MGNFNKISIHFFFSIEDYSKDIHEMEIVHTLVFYGYHG